MGVWRSDWVLIGADIGYDQFDEYKYEEYEKFEGVDRSGESTKAVAPRRPTWNRTC